MQEEYSGKLLKDGHISIPKEIIDKLKINMESKLHITVSLENEVKEKILSYAGLLSDLTDEEQRRFDESIKRRSLFGQRKAEI